MSYHLDLPRDVVVSLISNETLDGGIVGPGLIRSVLLNTNSQTYHHYTNYNQFINITSLSSITTTTTTLLTNIDNNLPEPYYSFPLLVLIAVVGSITSVLTVLGNILVMLAFFLDRQIRQPTNYFILSLSVSDFLIGLLSMPFLTLYIYNGRWPLNETICDIWLSLDYTVCLTSIYTVLFITIDRFCSVKMPAKYRKWRTSKKINIMIIITWAVPTFIFFSSTMIYPRIKKINNLQNGVCDVQWNKNRVFNLCLTIAYFWTTLIVMIILYIFIYGVASNLERKSRENARKMSSLVGMAGNAMTQIGIGVSKSPTKTIDKYVNGGGGGAGTSGSLDDDDDPQGLLAHSVMNTQNSSNSSEQKRDDDNSNSFESHSDYDMSVSGGTMTNEKKQDDNKYPRKTRRGMSVTGTSHTNSTSTRSPRNLNRNKQNVRFFASNMAHSLYRNTNRLSGFSSTISTKKAAISRKAGSGTGEKNIGLTTIPSEPELSLCRVYPPPQPRPETLAILSDEVFHEKLKLRQSPLVFLPPQTITTTLSTVNPSKSSDHRPSYLSLNFPAQTTKITNSNENLIQYRHSEDLSMNINDLYSITQSDTTTSYDKEETINDAQTTISSDIVTTEIANIKSDSTVSTTSPTPENINENIYQENLIEFVEQQSLKSPPLQQDISSESSDESWRLLNSNSSSIDEYIPYIDETDFEDLGYILHRRRVPDNLNEPVREETVVYKSPFYLKHKHRSKSKVPATNDPSNLNGGTKYEIYANDDAQMAILESAVYDSVELITIGATSTTVNDLDIQHRSLRNVSRETLLKNLLSSKPSSTTMSTPTKTPTSILNNHSISSSIILVSQAKSLPTTPLNQLAPKTTLSTTMVTKNQTIEQALLEFFQCGQLDTSENNRSNDNYSLSRVRSMTLANATLLNENEENTDFEQNEYNEISEETCSLLRLNEQKSSAFFDDDDFSTVPCDQQMMKKMMLNKQQRQDSDTNQSSHTMSINYSQDFSVDRIYNYESSASSTTNNQLHQPRLSKHTSSSLSSSIKNPISTASSVRSSTSSSTTSTTSSSRTTGIKKKVNDEQQFLSTEFTQQCQQTTSSDSDIVTTTSTTLPTSTQFSPDSDQKNFHNSITQDVLRAITKLSLPDSTLDSSLVPSSVATTTATATIMHVQAPIIPPCKNMILDSSINTVTNRSRLPIQKTYSQESKKSDTTSISKRIFNRTIQSSMNKDQNLLSKLEINSMVFDKRFSTSDTVTRDNDTSGYGSHDDPSIIVINNNRPSKVTFDHSYSGDQIPKTKDQGVMANIGSSTSSGTCIGGAFPNRTGGLGWSYGTLNSDEEKIGSGNQFGGGERAGITSGSTSAKSSVKELVRNQKSANHRKSKSQNRARKALRTITFILGAFVVCWTPWHIYSAVQSLCDACKDNVIFSNTLFHAVYFLCYLNSPINPFCYALANQQFKKTFTRILKLDLRRL
ncbi:unnamed protein product [Didymodactylos carnosus]|uniref:G-protein coupled receptors family 1 profile domain-containing protein n=1 Tax=Didymodactylos carnosus TaxID=1234261 RepID=A0A8S2HC21_9BILA|nr:unnamed protein product [Didymodactylos carnosus]CAF3627799.1 unnamed protein product [Didymodactylos carnosus]